MSERRGTRERQIGRGSLRLGCHRLIVINHLRQRKSGDFARPSNQLFNDLLRRRRCKRASRRQCSTWHRPPLIEFRCKLCHSPDAVPKSRSEISSRSALASAARGVTVRSTARESAAVDTSIDIELVAPVAVFVAFQRSFRRKR